MAWNRWNLCFLPCVCICVCVAPVHTCEMQTQAQMQTQENENFSISCVGACVCVCICVRVVHTCISLRLHLHLHLRLHLRRTCEPGYTVNTDCIMDSRVAIQPFKPFLPKHCKDVLLRVRAAHLSNVKVHALLWILSE